MNIFTLSLAAACLFATILLTPIYVGWASKKMVDQPNERSAHAVATPTGGGLVFLSVWIAGLATAAILDPSIRPAALAFAPPVALLIWLGWLDDRKPLPAVLRLGIQFGCAALFLVLWPWVGIADETQLLLVPVALLYLVYSTNITNFMDGIDAIVALQLMAFVIGALLILPPGDVFLPLMLLGAVVTGFLIFNHPPARLFMGDSGSAPLGLIVAASTLMVAVSDWRAGLGLLLLQGVFLADSAVTLLRRLLRRQNLARAHSEHGYQHAKRRWGHARVSYTLFALSMLVQLPLALAIARDQIPPWSAAIDVILLMALAVVFRAGTPRTD